MDPRSITDEDPGKVPSSPGAAGGARTGTAAAETKNSDVYFPAEDGGKSLAEMAQRDLTATLQLLAERAQYITAATGAAIALRDEDEMVCRASSGPSAPEVGALLQVNSGLSGESVRTRQTLRCDDAFTDPRVNRESCEALGIRSVVVMPLLRDEEVIGVFELFSDQANVFETRDLVALERMGTMVHTALEHSTAALGLPPMLGEAIQPMRASEDSTAVPPDLDEIEPSETKLSSGMGLEVTASSQAISAPPRPGIAFHGRTMQAAGSTAPEVPPVASVNRVSKRVSPSVDSGIADDDILAETARMAASRTEPRATPATLSFAALVARADQDLILSDVESARNHPGPARPVPAPADPRGLTAKTSPAEHAECAAPLPAKRTAVANLKKCEECGFPVSEGRQLCLDCEKKKTGGSKASVSAAIAQQRKAVGSLSAESMEVPSPSFLHSEEAEASWLSTHKFTVIALLLALIGILALLRLR
jgi:putative methionine-R-sulfoxide reductase with GAF domain